MTNATTSKGWDMSGTNAELIEGSRRHHTRLSGTTNVCAVDDDDWPCMTRQLADALEAAELTSVEDQMYVKRMESERDAALAVIAGDLIRAEQGKPSIPLSLSACAALRGEATK